MKEGNSEDLMDGMVQHVIAVSKEGKGVLISEGGIVTLFVLKKGRVPRAKRG